MNPDISVIIPNYNGAKTLEHCLKAAFASDHTHFEVIVVDDCSDDNSVEIIRRFPCRLLELDQHRGASAARNAGARLSRGKILFFTDADCVMAQDTLSRAAKALLSAGPDAVLGGTYQRQSFDQRFFSRFQSIFINYSESKHMLNPDYIASHAMAIYSSTFLISGGFREQWLPILEDVEFSHRLRRNGHQLRMNPDILVQHIFNYSLKRSFLNAIRKSSYWTLYSINNKDVLSDSGTASHELKLNVVIFYAAVFCLVLSPVYPAYFLAFAATLLTGNILLNRKLLRAFHATHGLRFSFGAAMYYFFVYPIPITVGGLLGLIKHIQTPAIQWVEN